MIESPIATKEYCNLLAKQLGLDPAGSAGHFDDAIVVETPLPWKRDLYEKAGALPQEMVDLLALWLERYKAGQPYNHRPLLIAPDADYSRRGHRRLIYYTRRPDAMARFDKIEYLVPDAESGPLAWALFEDRQRLPAYERYRVPAAEGVRDLLVCTHGAVDVACAKFGFPLYRHLRDEYADAHTRVWRVSHFGGHVFAPTLMDMPTGHYWAYVGEAQAQQIVTRGGDVADLRGHYRGWAGAASGFGQAAEGDLWQREGWGWFDYAKTCTVLAQDGVDPQWMELRFDFVRPDGSQGSFTVRVEITHRVETMPSTDSPKQHAYPQYAVTAVESAPYSHTNSLVLI